MFRDPTRFWSARIKIVDNLRGTNENPEGGRNIERILVYWILHSKGKIGKFKIQLQVLGVEGEVSAVPNVIKIRKLLTKMNYIYRHYISSMSGCWSFINTRGFSRYSFRHSFSSVWSLYNYEIICFIKTCNKTQ